MWWICFGIWLFLVLWMCAIFIGGWRRKEYGYEDAAADNDYIAAADELHVS